MSILCVLAQLVLCCAYFLQAAIVDISQPVLLDAVEHFLFRLRQEDPCELGLDTCFFNFQSLDCFVVLLDDRLEVCSYLLWVFHFGFVVESLHDAVERLEPLALLDVGRAFAVRVAADQRRTGAVLVHADEKCVVCRNASEFVCVHLKSIIEWIVNLKFLNRLYYCLVIAVRLVSYRHYFVWMFSIAMWICVWILEEYIEGWFDWILYFQTLAHIQIMKHPTYPKFPLSTNRISCPILNPSIVGFWLFKYQPASFFL